MEVAALGEEVGARGPTGLPERRSQSGIRGERVGRGEPGERADLSEEARARPVTHPWQAQDDRRLGLEQETVADLLVERLDPLLQRSELAGDLGDEPTYTASCGRVPTWAAARICSARSSGRRRYR